MVKFIKKEDKRMNGVNKRIAGIAEEIIGRKGIMKLINDTELTDNGSHYVDDYLGWSIWVFVEGYHSMSPKKRTKYIYIERGDNNDYQISWTVRLGERFVKDDIRFFCNLRYED